MILRRCLSLASRHQLLHAVLVLVCECILLSHPSFPIRVCVLDSIVYIYIYIYINYINYGICKSTPKFVVEKVALSLEIKEYTFFFI